MKLIRTISTSRRLLQEISTRTVTNDKGESITVNSEPDIVDSNPVINKGKYTPKLKELPISYQNKTPLSERVQVNPSHGLYKFFENRPIDTQRGEVSDGTGNGKHISSTLPTWTESQSLSSRSWRASELRLKSFEDLHTLWYLLLQERNVLFTQLEEGRRLGIDLAQTTRINERKYRVRKSMNRIKFVLSERRHAIDGNL